MKFYGLVFYFCYMLVCNDEIFDDWVKVVFERCVFGILLDEGIEYEIEEDEELI